MHYSLIWMWENVSNTGSISVARQRGVYSGFRLRRVIEPTSRNFGYESDRGDEKVTAFPKRVTQYLQNFTER